MSLRTSLLLVLGFLLGAVIFTTTSVLIAWTGPSAPPPASNVSPPIHVGSVDHVKNAGLSVNALAVFGNAIISGTSRYLNFGITAGASGYGIRDNAGTMEFKNASGAWAALGGAAQTSSGITDICMTGNTSQCNCNSCAGGAAGWIQVGCWDMDSGGGQGRPSLANPLSNIGSYRANLCVKQ